MSNKISSRIRELRKANGFKSAESLAEALDVSLKTVQGWENESKESNITLQNLLKMCDLFHCDLDYLIGRIDRRTHDNDFICEKTHLWEEAVEKIISFSRTKSFVLSSFVADEHFDNFLECIINYFQHHDEDEQLDGLNEHLINRTLFKTIDSVWEKQKDLWNERKRERQSIFEELMSAADEMTQTLRKTSKNLP